MEFTRRNALTRVWALDELVFRLRATLALLRVSRSDDSRIDELVHAIGRDEQLGVFELDENRVAGQHVGDVHREHVRTALLEQRRALPLFLGGLELRLRLLAFLDLRDDAYLTDRHRHAGDGGPC